MIYMVLRLSALCLCGDNYRMLQRSSQIFLLLPHRLASTLKSMEPLFSQYPEYKQVIMVSQIIQNYMDMALNELEKYTHTVSLHSILRNNTRLIELIETAFSTAPEIAELFMTQPISAQSVRELSLPGHDSFVGNVKCGSTNKIHVKRITL